MPRSMWSGSVRVGMVVCPVKLYTATESQEVPLHLVHRDCGTRIKQQRFCVECDTVIPWNDVDRGYEAAKGQIVQIKADELDLLRVPSTKIIDLIGFVDAAESPGRLFAQSSYYIKPEQVGAKPMALLVQAMQRRKRLAVGKISLRRRERLCLIEPVQDGRLAMHLLHWSDEVRDESFYHLETHQFPKAEMDLALDLVDGMTTAIDLTEHKDTYREAVGRLVEAKISSGDVHEQPIEEPTPVPATELMAQIRQSVDALKEAS